MIVDEAIIHVRSGRGGDGCVSFRRAKYIPKGGPDGGSGGNGGDLIVEARDDVDTLLDFSGRHHWKAEHGRQGGNKDCDGKAGQDLLIRMPVGTLIRNAETGELIVDLSTVGQRVVLCAGGKGGKGNMYFATPTDQAPQFAEPGGPLQEMTVTLELKLIADVGLLGMPNAGKSTLLSTVSSARPKVADYPFTTLSPHPGIAELSGGRRVVIADIPGLIEHAAEGAGLGTRFLRHVERTRLLLHLIDAMPPDGSDPAENYAIIRGELERHSAELASKPEILVLSKVDLLGGEAERNAMLDRLEAEIGVRPMPISAVTRSGLNALLEDVWGRLGKDVTSDEASWPMAPR